MVEFRSERFDLQPVGPGAWTALGRRSAGLTSNAGIVDLGNVTLVVDSFLTLQAAQELRTACRVLTGRDPSALVNTHWHFDHCLGNVVFRDCEIYGTAHTREQILRQGEGFLPGFGGEAALRRLKALEAQSTAESRPLFHEELAVETAARRELYEMFRSLLVCAPNQVYTARYNFPTRKSAWIVEVEGLGEGRSMVFVPDAEVLFAGDVLFSGTHPALSGTDPERWRTALRHVQKIGAARLVPGHGPVGGAELPPAVLAYVTALQEAAQGPDPVPVPRDYAAWTSPSLFGLNIRAARG
jgi:cyclase